MPTNFYKAVTYMLKQNLKYQWIACGLIQKAHVWCQRMRKRMRTASEYSSWWHFIPLWKTDLVNWLNAFKAGSHRFSPMMQYQFKDETILVWSYLDRLMLHLLLKIIAPTFKHVISPLCLHLKGPSAIKSITADLKTALSTGGFTSCLRIDIKSYYASINHRVLLKQLKDNYADPILLRYFEDIVTVAIDCGGNVFLPRCGIPLRSSLSPFFGALYLTALDRAFENCPRVFYRRYMDGTPTQAWNKWGESPLTSIVYSEA